MLRDYVSLSFANVRHRGVRSWLTMLGIFIGIAAVVSLISLGEGLQQAITGQFSSLGSDRLIVQNAGTGFGPPGSTSVKKLTDHDLQIIRGIQGVDKAIPRYIRTVRVDYNKIAQFEFITSIPNEQDLVDSVYEAFNIEIAKGRLLKSGDRGKVVLGDDFADPIEFDKIIRVGSRITIQGENFEVVGILKKAGSFELNGVIFMPEKDLKELLSIGDEIDVIAVMAMNEKVTPKVSEEIYRAFRKDRKEKVGEEDFSVQTPVQALESINTVLNIINLIVSGIAAISLFVGAVGITNTMYTSVLERTKEIGIMKAIGARNSDVMLIFLLESGLLGLVGGVVGAFIGLGLAFGISSLLGNFLGGAGLEIQVSWLLVLGAIGFSAIVGIISGILPALQASRLRTVEALRK